MSQSVPVGTIVFDSDQNLPALPFVCATMTCSEGSCVTVARLDGKRQGQEPTPEKPATIDKLLRLRLIGPGLE